MLYLKNEVGGPLVFFFFCISDKRNSLFDCSKSILNICVVEDYRVNVLKISEVTGMIAKVILLTILLNTTSFQK